MIETAEDIQTTLDIAGEDLVFELGTIKGIPGTLVYNVPSFDSPYDIEKQDFSFQISSNDFFAYVITKSTPFTYLLNNKVYNFEVTSYTDDLVGWIELRCNLIKVEDNV